jgi:hypothetical protein
MKPSYLIKGFPGHLTHAPLTDATIGMYALAAILAVYARSGCRRKTWRAAGGSRSSPV